MLLALSIFLIQEIAFSQGTLSAHSLKYFFTDLTSLYTYGAPFFSLWPCYLEEWLHSETMSLTVLHSILKKNLKVFAPHLYGFVIYNCMFCQIVAMLFPFTLKMAKINL